MLSPARRAHFCTKRRSRLDAVRISLSNWLLSNHTVNLHPRVCLRAKFSWDMTENGRKYIASKPRIEMLHNITYVYMHEEAPTQHIYNLARGRMSSSRSRWPRTSARSAADVIVAGLILVHGALQDQPRRYIKCFRLHKLMSVLFLFQGRVILGWVAWD